VLPQQAATGRRRPPKSGAFRDVTVVPNLFAGDGLVHRFDGNDRPSISRFFDQYSGTSALIRGNSETVLSQLPDGIFQSCVTSPPYWSLRDYNIPGQIGLEDSVFAYIEHLARIAEATDLDPRLREIFITPRQTLRRLAVFLLVMPACNSSNQIEYVEFDRRMPEQMREIPKSPRILQTKFVTAQADGPILAFLPEDSFLRGTNPRYRVAGNSRSTSSATCLRCHLKIPRLFGLFFGEIEPSRNRTIRTNLSLINACSPLRRRCRRN